MKFLNVEFLLCCVVHEDLQWPLHNGRKIETERRNFLFGYPLRYFELFDTKSTVEEINLKGVVRLYS